MSKTQMALKQQADLVNAEKHSPVNVMVTQSVSVTGKCNNPGDKANAREPETAEVIHEDLCTSYSAVHLLSGMPFF